jgi:hypothetical protein
MSDDIEKLLREKARKLATDILRDPFLALEYRDTVFDSPEDLKPLVRRNALSVSHDRFRADAERLIDSVGEVLEAAQAERPARPPEGPQKLRSRASGQGKPEPLPSLGAGAGAPPPDRAPNKGVTANLKRPRQLLVVIGIGIVVCLLGVSLFQATRPQPVSTGGSSSPTPAPLAVLNSPSSTPLVSQVSPSPSPSGAEDLSEAKHSTSSPIPASSPTPFVSQPSPNPTPSGADLFGRQSDLK